MKRAAGLLALSVLLPSMGYADAPQRLSDWLLAHPPGPDDYPLGLSWRVPGEAPAQEKLRADLLQSLSGDDHEVKAAPQALRRLHEWIAALPVTGRVPLAAADARWLQMNPAQDPVLQTHQDVVLPKRPATVTVVTAMGKRCAVRHVPGRRAMDYVRVCEPLRTKQTDWAWVVQPDGQVRRFGVAAWNLEAQDEPAPGAWIWAPSRSGGWPERVSQRLAEFLATQGPAFEAGVEERSDDASPPSGETLRGMGITSSDWGSVGLLQTPTARMRPAGELSFTLTRVPPYTPMSVFLQPFDWMEVGFRYTNISNALYGPAIAGQQAYKDKSIDVKLRLSQESAYLPQFAVGMRDITGTGLFSGEYLVASKRHNDFDWSLGLGWGYFGARGDVRNPLGRVFPAFDTRDAVVVGQGGNFDLHHYFRGPTALFGGVQYRTPWEPLTLKLEYDGNNYQHEPFGNNLKQASPWNAGLVYRVADTLDVSLGVERGNAAMVGITLHTPLDKISMPKLADPPRIPVTPARPQQAPDWAATGRELARQTNWPVRSIAQEGDTLRVTFDDVEAGYWRDRLDRTLSVLHRDAPAAVESFTIDYRKSGVDVAEQRVNRDAWVEQRTQALPPGAQREAVVEQVPSRPSPDEKQLYRNERPAFDAKLGMDFNYSFGGPDGFVLFQFAATEKAKLRFSDDTWLQGGVQLSVLDNYNKFKYEPPVDPSVQRVRTYVREYKVTSAFTMPNLQLTHVGQLSENSYYSLYGGYLESMFAGVGGEWLYRPYQGRHAFGVDVNAVQQREFSQGFGFLDREGLPNYRTVTGHASWYWDTGWNNVQTYVAAGRYLAKDIGVTVNVSRVFENGVRIGAGFTKTDMSAAQFGEGSFDKWMYVSFPFDAMTMRSGGATANFVWKPLQRDGGAMLGREVTLYDVTMARDKRATHYKPAPLPAEMSSPEAGFDNRSHPEKIEPYTYVTPKVDAVQWRAQTLYQQRLQEALYRQHFRDIKIEFDRSYRLLVSLSNDDIRPVSRAVGRAVRAALLNAPVDAREIRVTFLRGAPPAPAAEYDFIDLPRLQRYLDGGLTESELANSVAISWFDPAVRQENPLEQLGDMETISENRSLVQALMPDSNPYYRTRSDLLNAGRYAAGLDWFQLGMIGTGMVLGSAILDKRDDRFFQRHAQDAWLRNLNNAGNVAIPLVMLGGAATAAFGSSDPVLSRTGYSALEAGATALLVNSALSYAVGRARPDDGLGAASFHSSQAASSGGSFPSDHTALVWALATPFAEEYQVPWLYGAAAVTNFSRMGSRRHWFSDTVAGSLLGYGIGKIFWESSRAPGRYPSVSTDGRTMTLNWRLP